MYYLVPGYLFVSLFNFIVFKDREIQLNHLFFKSIVASFVLKSCFDFINGFYSIMRFPEGGIEYTLSLFVFVCIMAYLLGELIQMDIFNKLIFKIGIRRTTNSNIWDDVIKPGCWVNLISPTKEVQYLGQYEYGEEYSNEPIIVLSRYQVLDLDGNVITDYSDDKSRKTMLNTKNFERIDIIYNEKPKHTIFKRNKKLRIKKKNDIHAPI